VKNIELRKHFKYYIRGVGVGLIIAWVTSAIAYWKVGGSSTDVALIELELILSIIFLAMSIFMKDKTK
jgi:predicted branched-subunit amino acid permease